MTTKELIRKLDYKESSTHIYLETRIRDEIVKRLEENERLKKKILSLREEMGHWF